MKRVLCPTLKTKYEDEEVGRTTHDAGVASATTTTGTDAGINAALDGTGNQI
jgi:hypothetical protein